MPDMGFLNVIPLTVLIDDDEAVALDSEESFCVKARPGKHDLRLVWIWDPREAARKGYSTDPLAITVPKQGEVRFEVCTDQEAGYARWTFAPVGSCTMAYGYSRHRPDETVDAVGGSRRVDQGQRPALVGGQSPASGAGAEVGAAG